MKEQCIGCKQEKEAFLLSIEGLCPKCKARQTAMEVERNKGMAKRVRKASYGRKVA